MESVTVEVALAALKESGTVYVKESDLLAAKKGLETSLGQVRTELATLKAESDSKHQEVLDAQAALKEAEGKLSTTNTSAGKAAEDIKGLRQQLVEATKSREESAGRLLGLRRLAITTKIPKMDQAELEKMTPEQLDALETTIKHLPDGARPTYDGGSGGGGGGSELRPRQKIAAGLADRDK